MRTRTMSMVSVAALAAMFLLGGCAEDAMCSSGEYPVKAIRSTTGGACVPDGQDPPAGYVRYPAGKVPQHVDDKWDKYWSEHMLDEKGTEIADA
ncbi:SCO0607 family lipoprotein [Nucisporomicrobium flavum]|uniref:SCO0607 family lipoprotein n=1 Tax=Nucisporomicrobium flavum TaxID=2785915 RepID=UPI001F20B1D8|nr:hypothetical protein [Nucisporomicrobium flavum]